MAEEENERKQDLQVDSAEPYAYGPRKRYVTFSAATKDHRPMLDT